MSFDMYRVGETIRLRNGELATVGKCDFGPCNKPAFVMTAHETIPFYLDILE